MLVRLGHHFTVRVGGCRKLGLGTSLVQHRFSRLAQGLRLRITSSSMAVDVKWHYYFFNGGKLTTFLLEIPCMHRVYGSYLYLVGGSFLD